VVARNGGVGPRPKPAFAQLVALLVAHGGSVLRAGLSPEEAVAATQRALVSADAATLAHLSRSESGGHSEFGSNSRGGANMNAEHPATGRTALHEAAVAGHLVACQQLVQHGSDPNARDLGGFTSLELAAYRDAAEESCDDGGDDDDGGGDGGGNGYGNGNGGNARRAALARGLESVVVFLVELGGELGTAAQAEKLAWRAAYLGSGAILTALAAHPKPGQACAGASGKAAVPAAQWHGCPALWIAVQRGHGETCVRALLAAGADPSAPYASAGAGSAGRFTPGKWQKAVVPAHGDQAKLVVARSGAKRVVALGNSDRNQGGGNGGGGFGVAPLFAGDELWVRLVVKQNRHLLTRRMLAEL
jgi:hypothetical protein